MHEIFISYRRNATKAEAGRLRDRLDSRFWRKVAFVDEVGLKVTEPFPDLIAEKIRRCKAFICLVHREWEFEIKDREKNAEIDWVLKELEIAVIARKPIIFAFVDRDPNIEYLPERLALIKILHGIRIDSGKDFNRHVDDLILIVKKFTRSHWCFFPYIFCATQFLFGFIFVYFFSLTACTYLDICVFEPCSKYIRGDRNLTAREFDQCSERTGLPSDVSPL